jgi:nucleotide-binding universal stress UspA family protein
MHAHRPILAVPETTTRMGFERALIAWDGEASCAATLRACVPLLTLAENVEIFMVRDGAQGTDPAEAAEYLSRHGIHPAICVVDDAVTRPDELIAEECVRWKADYVVMGAYGRGRLMESFGGVTKRLLAKSEVPLVLGH